MPRESPTTFTIRELTGERRVLQLMDRALPYRPYELAGTQRVTTTWYPGSPVATIQVLGAAEEPTTIIGMWKDRFLGGDFVSEQGDIRRGILSPATLDGQKIATAQNLANAVDDFRRKGQLIEVTWRDTIRQGIITEFRQRWVYPEDLEWEITFTWISQGEAQTKIEFVETNTDVSDIPPRKEDELTTIANQVLDVGGAIVGFQAEVGDTIQETLRQMAEGVEEARSIVAQQVALLISPFEALQRMAGTLDGIRDNARLIRDSLDFSDSLVLNSNSPLGTSIKQRRDTRVVARVATRSSHDSAREVREMDKRINPELVRTFFANAGQDLRDVSTRFYGVPDQWRNLKRFNGLQSSSLAAGQLVFVPANPETLEPRIC